MPTATPRALDLDLARTILEVVPHFFRIAAHAVRERRAISIDRFKALMTLERCPEMRMRSGELAQRWHLTAPAVTRLVDDLEEDGLVRRIADASDRRAVVLTLTAEGKRELRRFDEVAAGAVAEVLATLTPEQRRRLRDAFGDLERVLNQAHPQEERSRTNVR